MLRHGASRSLPAVLLAAAIGWVPILTPALAQVCEEPLIAPLEPAKPTTSQSDGPVAAPSA